MLDDIVSQVWGMTITDILPGAFLGYFSAALTTARDYAHEKMVKIYAMGAAASLFATAGMTAYRHNDIGTETFLIGNLFSGIVGLLAASAVDQFSLQMYARKMRKKHLAKRTAAVQTYRGENRVTKYLTSDTIPGIEYDPHNN